MMHKRQAFSDLELIPELFFAQQYLSVNFTLNHCRQINVTRTQGSKRLTHWTEHDTTIIASGVGETEIYRTQSLCVREHRAVVQRES